MEQIIFESATKNKCDVKDCKNEASYFFAVKGRWGKFFICKNCLDVIANRAITFRTPKSPKNTIKKIMDGKMQGENK